MTALDTLLQNSSSFLTVGLEGYTLTTCAIDEDKNITPLGTTTTTSLVSATLNKIEVNDNLLSVREAQSYVQSMSDEQLQAFDELLHEKELTFEIPDQIGKETEKIYIKKS